MANLKITYQRALQKYLDKRSEPALHQAYELARESLAANTSFLDIVNTHNDALGALLKRSGASAKDMQRQVADSGKFLTETLAPFALVNLRDQETSASLRQLNTMLENEAKRVAYALHDEAASLLAIVYIELGKIAQDNPASAAIRPVLAHLDRLRQQLRSLSHEIHSPILDQFGLIAALQTLGDNIAKRTGMKVSVGGVVSEQDLSTVTKATIYRVTQEALANAHRHGKATSVKVTLSPAKGRIVCVIKDNGSGFDQNKKKKRSEASGLGLKSMRDRATALSGSLEIKSAGGKGTTIELSLPCDEETEK